MNESRTPPPHDDEERDSELITAPIAEIERDERRAFVERHRGLLIGVASLAFVLILAAGSVGFLVGRGGEDAELVNVSDGSAPRVAGDVLRPVEGTTLLTAFFWGTVRMADGQRSAITLRFGEPQVEGRGWMQAEYVINTERVRERGVALLQPSAKRLLLGSGESLEIGRDASGDLAIRGGSGRRINMRSDHP